MQDFDDALQSGEELRARIVARAVEDLSFRSELVSDPKTVINREFGVEIPESVEIEVHESDFKKVHLALPPSFKLAEEQLAAFAGGACVSTTA